MEEDLHFKLQTLQDMFTSTRPVSILYLRGEDLDDPDAHPVALPGDPAEAVKTEAREGGWRDRSGQGSVTGSSLVSPSPSSLSLHSQVSAVGFHDPSSSRQGSDQPTKISKTDEAGNLSGWIEALGVDPSYRPPPDRAPKPVACFYLLRRNPMEPQARELHRAVYLMERTLKEFVAKIAAKWSLDASRVVRIVHVSDRGLEVEMDDDVIAQLAEGQDMGLEVTEIRPASQSNSKEWEMAVDLPGGESASTQTVVQSGYELRLAF
jgi:hypothetical protein